MSATMHPGTPHAASWASVHRALLLVLAAVVVTVAVAATMLVLSREPVSTLAPTPPAADVTTTQDCGTLLEPVPC